MAAWSQPLLLVAAASLVTTQLEQLLRCLGDVDVNLRRRTVALLERLSKAALLSAEQNASAAAALQQREQDKDSQTRARAASLRQRLVGEPE